MIGAARRKRCRARGGGFQALSSRRVDAHPAQTTSRTTLHFRPSQRIVVRGVIVHDALRTRTSAEHTKDAALTTMLESIGAIGQPVRVTLIFCTSAVILPISNLRRLFGATFD